MGIRESIIAHQETVSQAYRTELGNYAFHWQPSYNHHTCTALPKKLMDKELMTIFKKHCE